MKQYASAPTLVSGIRNYCVLVDISRNFNKSMKTTNSAKKKKNKKEGGLVLTVAILLVFPNRDFQNIKIVSSFNLKEDIKMTVRKWHQMLEILVSTLIDRNATDKTENTVTNAATRY